VSRGNGSKAPQERFILLGRVILETWRVLGKATVEDNVLYLIVTMRMSDKNRRREREM
jgi:hypothetical protein